MPLSSSLLNRRLILVCGKGGVGRSTVAASLASACAQAGRRTLLFQSNAADRMGRYFGTESLASSPRQLAPSLWGVNTNPATALAEYGLMILKFQTVYDMVFENRVSKAFIRAIPGVDDYAILGKAWFHTMEEKAGKPVWDTVVFDMPASGHSLSMLRIPKVIIDTVPEGPLTRDARTIMGQLRDPARTALVLVTLAEEMPVNEARELDQALRTDLGIAPQAIIANQVFPNHVVPGSIAARVAQALASSPDLPADLAAVMAHVELHRARARMNLHYLEVLRQALPLPVAELPMLFSGELGPTDIRGLANALIEA